MVRSILKTKRTNKPIIVVDGNDGTGKSTLAVSLRKLGYLVKDRGIPSLMTDGERARFPKNEIYIILDAPIATCRLRLKTAGKDLNKKYHTVRDLTHYRSRFLEVAKMLPRCVMIDASGTLEEVIKLAIHAIDQIRNNH
jgi:thymidylate kinase